MKLPSSVKRVVESLAMETVLEGVRGYLKRLLRDVTPKHMYKAIAEDADPWDYAPRHVKIRGKRWAHKLRKHKDKLTPELVLDWLKTDHTNLATVVIYSGPKGKRWLAKWTERIKDQLWPPEKEPEKKDSSLKLVKIEEDAPADKPKVVIRNV